MSYHIFQTIRNRRSIRNFVPNKVPKGLLQKLLEAAKWAPSAHNAQPWRFIVMTDRDLKQKFATAMADEWAKDMIKDGVSLDVCKSLVEASIRRFVQAPVLIIAAITMEEIDKYPDATRQKNEHIMATQSLAAAVQNMLLAANSEGLGSCWFCAPLFCQDVVRKVLGVPQNVEPQALITIGYPSEHPEPPPRKALGEIVFKDRWGETF